MSEYVPIEMAQHSTFSKTITVKSSSGVLQNLHGYNVNAAMSRSYYSANKTPIITTITDASNGEISLTLSAQDTSNLIPGRYVYDVVVSTIDATTRVVEGIVVVNPGVSK